MKKSFTLIEMLISMLLGSIILYYTYNTINTTTKNHKTYETAAQDVYISGQVLLTLYRDLLHSIGNIEIIHNKKFDAIRFYTRTSMHSMHNPYITYFVSKKDNALIRVESKEYFDIFNIGSNKTQSLPYMFSDILTTECDSFRVSYISDKVDVMFRKKKSDMILFSVYKAIK